MRCTIILLLSSCFLVVPLTAQKPNFRRLDLPDTGKTLIQECIGKWEYFKSTVPAFDSTGSHIGQDYADIIAGDFNGDRDTDYAILARSVDSVVTNKGYLIVLFKKLGTFDVRIADSVNYSGSLVLILEPRGGELFDFDTDSTFKLQVDGILLYVYEKAGYTYYYQDGKFHHVLTSD